MKDRSWLFIIWKTAQFSFYNEEMNLPLLKISRRKQSASIKMKKMREKSQCESSATKGTIAAYDPQTLWFFCKLTPEYFNPLETTFTVSPTKTVLLNMDWITCICLPNFHTQFGHLNVKWIYYHFPFSGMLRNHLLFCNSVHVLISPIV